MGACFILIFKASFQLKLGFSASPGPGPGSRRPGLLGPVVPQTLKTRENDTPTYAIMEIRKTSVKLLLFLDLPDKTGLSVTNSRLEIRKFYGRKIVTIHRKQQCYETLQQSVVLRGHDDRKVTFYFVPFFLQNCDLHVFLAEGDVM